MRFLFSLLSLLLVNSAYASPQTYFGGEGGTVGDEGNAPAGTINLVTSPVKTGTYAYQVNPGVGGTGNMRVYCIAANGSLAACNLVDAYPEWDFYVGTLPTATQANTEIFTAQDTSFSTKATVKLNSSGNLFITGPAGTTLATGTTVLSASTWYRLALHLGTGASANYEIKLNNVQEVNGTTSMTVNFGGNSTFGITTNTTNGLPVYYYDNMVVDNAAYVGPAYVHRMAPAANGSTQQWLSGTGTTYTEVSEIPANAATYLKNSAVVSQVALVTLGTSAASGISGTVLAAKAWVALREDTAVTSSCSVRIREGATNSDNTGIDINPTTVATVNLFKLMTTKPSGGAWTTAALDATEIGAIEANAVADRMEAASLMVLSTDVSAATTVRLLSSTGVGQ